MIQHELNYSLPHNGTETSREAAKSQSPKKTEADKLRILAFVNGCQDGATRDEIEVHLGMRVNTINPRVNELVAQGKLSDGPDKRLTRGNCKAGVLRAVK